MSKREKLKSGRTIYNTGKVKVGLLAGGRVVRTTQASRDEILLQRALVEFGSVEGNAMHPDRWISFRNKDNKRIAANRSRYDEAFDFDAPTAAPTKISLKVRWWRRAMNSARLYFALALAQAKGMLK